MTTPEDIVKALSDVAVIIQNAITGNYLGELPAALTLVNDVLVALPPLDAKDLDPVERAKADAESDAAEKAKFGP